MKKEPNRKWDYNAKLKTYMERAQTLNNVLRKV
jgi:hypothetical protein